MPPVESKFETWFPKLSGTNYEPTSDATNVYNCIAWAAGEDYRWWEPGLPYDVGYYWPKGATEGDDMMCLIEAYRSIGYRDCQDGTVQDGFDKVALYGNSSGEWTHAARQLPSGTWTSKLGPYEDIEHERPDHLEGVDYGSVDCYMKRRRLS